MLLTRLIHSHACRLLGIAPSPEAFAAVRHTLLTMRPEEYNAFRRKLLLARGVGHKSWRAYLDLLGLSEMHVVMPVSDDQHTPPPSPFAHDD